MLWKITSGMRINFYKKQGTIFAKAFSVSTANSKHFKLILFILYWKKNKEAMVASCKGNMK
jgi:hypothetical protein